MSLQTIAPEVQLVMMPRPFSVERVDKLVPHGLTLMQMLEAVQPDPVLLAHAHVYVGDHYVSRCNWHLVRPNAGTRVTARVVPAGGGGGGGKSPLRIVLTIAVIVAAAYLGPLAAGAMGYTGAAGGATLAGLSAATSASVVGGVIGGVISMAGMMLVNAIAPIRPPQMQGMGSLGASSERQSQTLFITGARNAAQPFGVVPRPLGFHRMVPPLGSLTYTEIVGEDQYIRMLLVWGYGPLDVSELRVGETPLSDFQGVEIETRQGYANDAPITLFPADVYEEGLNVALTASGGGSGTVGPSQTLTAGGAWATASIQAADALRVDLALPSGLGSASSGHYDLVEGMGSVWVEDVAAVQATATFEIEVAPGGTTDWVPAVLSTPTSGALVSGNQLTLTASSGSLLQPTVDIRPPAIGTTEVRVRRLAVDAGSDAFSSTWTATQWQTYGWVSRTSRADADELSVDIAFPQGLVYFDDGGSRTSANVQLSVEYRVVDGPTWLPVTTLNVTDAKASAVRVGHRWTMPVRGQYEVRIRRLTADSDSTRRYDSSAWSVLRTITNEDPISMAGLAKTALRIKATGQLSGVLDQLNGVVKSIALDYDDPTGTWIERATNNPASLIRLVQQGAGNARPLADSRIDLEGLEEFHDHCRINGLGFNQVRDFRASVWDTMADIASTGFASPAIRDGKWGVVVDRPRTTVAQHFTPRNSWGMEVEHAFVERPHGWRVRFVNEDADWRQDERIVYDDGYSEANANKFEGLEAPGVTDPDQIWKVGRRTIAAGRLRPARYNFSADVEHLVCTRGDRIKATHDVIGVGLASARLKDVVLDEDGLGVSLVLDEVVTMEPGKSYGLSIRTASDMALAVQVDTAPGSTLTLTPTTAIPADQVPLIGDLVGFGELGQETKDLVVLKIESGRDMSAKLVCLDYAPEIFTADAGTIPAHASALSSAQGLATPVVAGVRSDEAVLEQMPDGTLVPALVIDYALVSARASVVTGLEAQFRRQGESSWGSVVALRGDARELRITPVTQGVVYEVRSRFLTTSAPGPWSHVLEHSVVGMATLPDDVPELLLQGGQLVWSYPVIPRDFAGFRVKHVTGGLANWDGGLLAHTGLLTTAQLDVAHLTANETRCLMVKAVDKAGNESLDAAVLVVGLGNTLYHTNVIDEVDYGVLGFPGSLTGGVASGGQLVAGDDGADYLASDSDLYLADDTADYLVVNYLSMTYAFDYVLPVTGVLVGEDFVDLGLTVTGAPWSVEYRPGVDGYYLVGDESDYLADDEAEYLPFDFSVTSWPWPGRTVVPPGTEAIRFTVSTSAGSTPGTVSAASVVLEARPQRDTLEDVALDAAGERLQLDRSWRKIKAVRLTLQDDGGSAFTAKVLDKDEVLGPMVRGFTSAGTGAAALVDAEIEGY